ncbi:hypothetical protein [Phytohabitans houttuyneae]|uniref:Core-binding (CB) domain-containing protein n=1 Tax=Phytohabitans houttuyneae TaxID=1076126 RepID=A0A6V8KKT2_9ACTN|nr:hypothetical protein [Phytohabitans houttuyneae]GFJ85792.1 hypothetical protein Phou_099720 [Phytohabitans houttuyneae]
MTSLASVRPQPAAAPRRQHPLEEMFVLHGRDLRAGTALAGTARFSDDVWPLAPILHRGDQRSLILDFTTLPSGRRLLAKELIYSLLSGPLPRGEVWLDPVTIRETFSELKRLFGWMQQRPGGDQTRLAELTPADLLTYQHHLLNTLPGSTSRGRARGVVRRFWRHRNNLLTDRLTVDPRRIDGWGEPNRHPDNENATDRIPETVFGPLLAWALRFIDDFAADILAADTKWRTLRHQPRRTTMPGDQVPAALRKFLDEHRAHSRPLPGYAGRPNLTNIAERIGATTLQLRPHRSELDAVAAIVGLSTAGQLDVPITGRLDGHPWIPAIASMHKGTRHGLGTLARLLQAACYVTIAFLSGMRDSEIKHLRRGCLRVERDPNGTAYRWKLHGTAFKGERDPSGSPATWAVGQPVARAVEVLERLQPDRDLLFARLPHGPGNGPAAKGLTTALVNSSTNTQLNEFSDWVNAYCAEHGRADIIPIVNGQPWRLKTSQFRRTLAWFIARRPGGAIAGAIHYRHLSIQMFEGYAGTSDSGFRAEVESEQAIARGEHLLAMVDKHEHHSLSLTGPGAAEAHRRLDDFAGSPSFAGSVITDPRRLLRLMRKHDPAIYPSDYVTCVYDQAKALCHKTNRAQPDLVGCWPLDCRNTALTESNLDTWRAEATRIKGQLQQRPALPPLLHHQLTDRLKHLTNFIARHEGQPT